MSRSRRRSRRNDPDQFLDSKLFRWGTRLFLGIVVAVVFLTLAQCTVEKPQSPKWVTTMTVPVIDRSYPMSDLVNRMGQDELQVLNDSTILFSIEKEIDTLRLDQSNLTVPDIDTTIYQVVGMIDLSPPPVAPVAVNLADLVPLATSVPDTAVTVDNDMPTIASYETATISSGGVFIVLTNNLAVDIDSVDISLYDVANPSSPVFIAGQPLGAPLPDGFKDSVLFDLSGSSVSNSLRVSTSFHTPGGTSLRSGTKEFITNIRFNGPLSISSATNAAVPTIAVEDSARVRLGQSGDNDVVHSARLSSGTMTVTVVNNSNLQSDIWLQVPDLKNAGLGFIMMHTLAPRTSRTVNVDLTGWDIIPSDLSAPQEMTISMLAQADSDRVDIDENQNFSVTASLNSLSFGSVTGVFEGTTTSVQPTNHEIDIPEGFDGFELASAVLTLTLENSVQMNGDLDLVITGSNGKTLNVTGPVQPGQPGSPVTTVIVNNDVASFLSPIPDSVEVTGTASFGDGVTVGTLTPGDYVFATVKIESPLEMVVNPTSIDLDVESEDIDAANIDLITDHVEELRFVYSFDNGLPLGLSANIYLAQGSDVSELVHDLAISDLTVGAAPVGVDGRASGTTLINDTLVLTNADIQFLNADSVYVYTELFLAGSNGQTIRLLPDDAIKITGRLEVDYLFDGNF